jgi:4F5 protein related disordered region
MRLFVSCDKSVELFCEYLKTLMARGQQKIQSQQKNAEKQAKLKKAAGSDQKKAAAAALVYSCALCKVCMICHAAWFKPQIFI